MGNDRYINKDRIANTFIELVKIDSLSGEEEKISRHLTERFSRLGCEVRRDEVNNVIALQPGNINADPVMLCSHMDTVGQDYGVKPQIGEDGIIRSDGTTILGADDKSGIAIILEIMRVYQEHPELRHPDIEAVITTSEETGLKGSTALDKSRLRGKWGLILDHGGPIGVIVTSGPTSRHFRFTIHGKAAHAAEEPEKGVNAIQAAALSITKCPCGRLDDVSVSGIGIIHGGVATNIVPDEVVVEGMARSFDNAKLEAWGAKMEAAFRDGCAVYGAEVTIEKHDSYYAYNLTPAAKPWKRVEEACEKLDLHFRTEASLGGTDANVFNKAGIPCCATSTGMASFHMKSEHIAIQDMYDSARLVITAISE